jgi:pyruvate dehydrogenase E1 component alpha subunit/2-oxoisovalerate dehydrogenase E1 component alpha subunit
MRARKTSAAAVAFLGDGATSRGDFHAAMNFAGVWKVPCVLICQNDHGSTGVPAERQTASRTLAVKARAYGLPGVRVDGNDVLAIFKVVSEALAHARAGGGATFIEAVTSRMVPSSTSDDRARHRPRAELDAWARKDPLDQLRKHLVRRGLSTPAGDEALHRELLAEIAAAVDDVERLAPPERESLFADVYADMPWHLREQLESLKKIGAPPT